MNYRGNILQILTNIAVLSVGMRKARKRIETVASGGLAKLPPVCRCKLTAWKSMYFVMINKHLCLKETHEVRTNHSPRITAKL